MAKKKYARCFVGAALAAAVMMPELHLLPTIPKARMFMSSNANLAKRQLSAVVAMMLGALILPSLVQPLRPHRGEKRTTILQRILASIICGATALWFMWMALRMATATVELTVRNTVRQQ